jgi:hypothetical protein
MLPLLDPDGFKTWPSSEVIINANMAENMYVTAVWLWMQGWTSDNKKQRTD